MLLVFSIDSRLTIHTGCITNILWNGSVPALSQSMPYFMLLITSRPSDQSGHHGLFQWSVSVGFFSLPSKAADSLIRPLTSMLLMQHDLVNVRSYMILLMSSA
jgi:hypothetical protein